LNNSWFDSNGKQDGDNRQQHYDGNADGENQNRRRPAFRTDRLKWRAAFGAAKLFGDDGNFLVSVSEFATGIVRAFADALSHKRKSIDIIRTQRGQSPITEMILLADHSAERAAPIPVKRLFRKSRIESTYHGCENL